MASFKVFRETALPAFPLEPRAVYFVAPASAPNYVEIYVSNADGTAARRVLREADVQALVSAAVSAATQVKVVADIATRNALAPSSTVYVYVKTATADTTVASGGATYLYDMSTSEWVKVSEAESLDLTLSWSAIGGKPNSSVASIDAAVAASHTHANKTQLDKIGEDGSGNLTYGGLLPRQAWESAGW